MTFEMTDQEEASMEAQHVIEDLKRKIASDENKHYILMTRAFVQKIVNAMERACI